MKLLLFVILIVLVSSGYSQSWQWSQPIALTDSNTNNRSHSFIYTNWDNYPEYNYILWEKNFGDSSAVMIMRPANPDTEYVIHTSRFGTNCTNPIAQFYSDNTFFVIWQSNENGNFDLYNGFWSENGLTGFQQITSNSLNDINPKVCGNDLVWERNGAIITKNFNIIDTTLILWGEEKIIDSISCANPDIHDNFYPVIAYEKMISDSGKIYISWKLDSLWSSPVCISLVGDNRSVSFDKFMGEQIWWQHRNNNDWNLKTCYFDLYDTLTIYENFYRFSYQNETDPATISPILVTKDDIYTNLAFETDSLGNKEIFYVNDIFFSNPINISNHINEDRNPRFSIICWNEAPYGYYRIWLAWESYRNGHWQVWCRYADIPALGIEDENGLNLNQFNLYQNYPNPFNSQTSIKYYQPKPGKVKVEIFNVLGQKVKTLVDQIQQKGEHGVIWDGRDEYNHTVASGVYIYSLKSEKFSTSKKLLMLK